MEFLYRVEPNWFDENPEDFKLICWQYPIFKETDYGKWIKVFGKKKFVLNNSVKRFAHDNKDDAFNSFVYRRKKHGSWLKSRLNRNELVVDYAEKNGQSSVIISNFYHG